MTILTLLRTELRRLTATKLGVLAFVALMTVPLLYGGMYLWGNLDPYGRFSNVPAGIVVADTGTTDGGTIVNRGRAAADALVKAGDFDWRELTAAQAKRQLASGDVDFVLTFPATFSADLASVGTTDPTRARIALATNDANSYLSSTIAKNVATSVRDAVASQVGRAAAKRFLVSLSTIRSDLADASSGAAKLATGATSAANGAAKLATGTRALASGATTLASGASTAANGAGSLATGAKHVASGASSLSAGLDTLATTSRALPTGSTAVATGATQVATGSSALAAALHAAATSTATGQALAQRLAADGLSQTQIQQALAILAPGQQSLAKAAASADAIASGATKVASGSQQVAAGATKLATATGRAASGARTLSTGAKRVSTGAAALATGTAKLERGADSVARGATSAAKGGAGLASGTATLAEGATSLHSGLAKGVTRIPATTASQRTAQAEALGDPVAVRTTDTASAGTYGAGLAPLFLSLSAWIGAYALFLILRPLSRRAITAVRQPIRIALAGWLTPALLGALQMVALFAIAVGPLGIHIVDPVATIGLLLLTAATFAAILLALNAALGSVGQFLGLILMLVQLVTAGGTFPWQTLPGPLAALHHALPMAYAVDGLRQVMYGGDLSLARGDAGVLAVWLLASLAITAAIAARMTNRRTLRDLQPSLIGG